MDVQKYINVDTNSIEQAMANLNNYSYEQLIELRDDVQELLNHKSIIEYHFSSETLFKLTELLDTIEKVGLKKEKEIEIASKKEQEILNHSKKNIAQKTKKLNQQPEMKPYRSTQYYDTIISLCEEIIKYRAIFLSTYYKVEHPDLRKKFTPDAIKIESAKQVFDELISQANKYKYILTPSMGEKEVYIGSKQEFVEEPVRKEETPIPDFSIKEIQDSDVMQELSLQEKETHNILTCIDSEGSADSLLGNLHRETGDLYTDILKILITDWPTNINTVALSAEKARKQFEVLMTKQAFATGLEQKEQATLTIAGNILLNIVLPGGASVLASSLIQQTITKPILSTSKKLASFSKVSPDVLAEKAGDNYAAIGLAVFSKIIDKKAKPNLKAKKPNISDTLDFIFKWENKTIEIFNGAINKITALRDSILEIKKSYNNFGNPQGDDDIIKQLCCDVFTPTLNILQRNKADLAPPKIAPPEKLYNLFLDFFLLNWLASDGPTSEKKYYETNYDYNPETGTMLYGLKEKTIKEGDILAQGIRDALDAPKEYLDFKNGEYFSSEPENDIANLTSWAKGRLKSDFKESVWKQALGLG